MSDTSSAAFPGFSQFVPGFDFLQNLLKQTSNAAPGIPGMGGWVAPTLSVEDLEKRIQELKAVQFWLDQNANLLKATIQAMEVQKMTLATLHSMNVNMADMAQAFSVKPDSTTNTPPTSPRSSSFGFGGTAPAAAPALLFPSWVTPAPTATAAAAPSSPGAPAGVVDPMQWWGALTQQFQSIAANAMKDLGTPAPNSSEPGVPDTGFTAAAPAANPAPAPFTETAKPSAEAAVPGARTAGKSDLRHRAWPTPGASATPTDTSATSSPSNSKSTNPKAAPSKGKPASEN